MEMIMFPIIKPLYYPDGSETPRLIGTGFFLDSTGLFLSARHVFTDRGAALDKEDASGFAVYCVHTVNLQRKAVARYIDVSSIKTRNDTDIAAGRVEPRQFGKGDPSVTDEELKETAHFNLVSCDDVAVGTRIWSVAYPLTTVKQPQPGHVHIHAQSDAYEGKITKHYLERRDLGMLNWPCYETDMDIKGGAGGGPVFISGSGGVVCGINCSGFSAFTNSHITSLAPLSSKGAVSRLFPA
jgi:hypothetical protein